MPITFKIIITFLIIGLFQFFANSNSFLPRTAYAEKPYAISHYTLDNPASVSPIITWNKNLEAVYYEIEFFDKLPAAPDKYNISAEHIFYSNQIYTNAYNPDIRKFATQSIGQVLYWRIRGLDIEGQPVSEFSDLEPIYTSEAVPKVNSPIPNIEYNKGNGTTLLYPVYSWVPNHGAKKFEVEILYGLPDKPAGIEASEKRIDTLITDICEVYDAKPRYGEYPFYWRVRGMQADGSPVGEYSSAAAFKTSPQEKWQVGVYGDSISHGGGRVSYGPADWEYSYLTKLDFPVINLSKSGDTSYAMVERFERDVLPFRPHYLIVMGGTNSLRGGTSAKAVIEDLEAIKEKCLNNAIKPIFLTLPPINPANIERAFQEATAEDWQRQFALVNEYICQNFVHIDIAQQFASPDGILPTKYAVDGLHLDNNGKAIMAQQINAAWPYILPEADKQ